jgi:hypothetical protein
LAGHGSAADPISQGKTRLLPATPTFTGRPNTELAAFGGIDAKQSNAPAMDFDGVAIDYTLKFDRLVERAGHGT